MRRVLPVSTSLKAFLLIGAFLLFVYSFFWLSWPSRRDLSLTNVRYGITWSPPYARYLGLSSEEGLTAALEDLHVRHVRFSTEWSSIEPEQGVFRWEDLDRHLNILSMHQVPVTLAIGYKTPRWPECSVPTWAAHLSKSEREGALQQYLRALIEHVQERPEIVAWQVENEPFFPFGSCEARDLKDIQAEYELVRRLDPIRTFHRSITVTDSGEQGMWLPPSSVVDAIGFSVYRVTDNPVFGVRTYDWLPPWWYRRKMQFLRLFTQKDYYVSEFQMEPWVLHDLKTSSVEEMLKTFSLPRMQVNAWQLQRLGFAHIDLWGAEWWYWMKEQKGHPEFWEEAKLIFKK